MKILITLRHFLKRFRILLPLVNVLVFGPEVYAQNTYSLTLSDTATYDNNCGKVTSATWTVRYDSCVLYTPYFRHEEVDPAIVTYNFRVNQSGNGDYKDVAYVQVQRNNGAWVTDTLIHALAYTAVHNLIGRDTVAYAEIIRYRVILKTDNKNEFWAIFSGNMTVVGSFETYSGWPPPLESFPVELDYFNGVCMDNAIVLKWATFSELNCDYYNLERSFDGINFETAAFIDGAGNSNSYLKYAYVDEDIISVDIVYYRLKQVDMDAQYQYFGPISVENTNLDSQINIDISPNPARAYSFILVSFPAKWNSSKQIQIYNSSGFQLLNYLVEGSSYLFQLNQAGFYLIAVKSDNKIVTDKLLVK